MACSAVQPAALAARQTRATAPQQRAAAAAPAAAQRRQQRCRLPPPPRATPEQDLDAQLQADLERLRQRQAAAGGAPGAAAPQQPAAASSGGSGAAAGGGPLGGLKEAVDKVLIADFFFILFALAWLGAALAERSALQSTTLLDTWLSLWQWVFQPAIGVLMLGALVSGAAGWAKDNLGGGKQ